jgi:hypothetical protein
MPVRWGIFHPQYARQVMLATETGVWTTDNIDISPVVWTPVVTGMANVRVDQLNLRASDNTVIAASHGRGLFTTRWDVVNSVDQLQLQAFSMYPNPAGEVLNISFELNGKQNVLFTVFDLSGKSLMDENKGNHSGHVAERMNISNLSPGVYFVNIYVDGRKIRTEKFVKW